MSFSTKKDVVFPPLLEYLIVDVTLMFSDSCWDDESWKLLSTLVFYLGRGDVK